MPDRTAPSPDKAALRAAMRTLRRSLPDRAARSTRIWDEVGALDEVASCTRIMVFTSTDGEPDTESFIRWCADRGIATGVPDDDVAPTWPDVIIVPGLAFTVAGDRLGQGGGWYDRFLAGRRSDSLTVGVCFFEQLLDVVPIETHDIRLDCIVTDRGTSEA